MSGPQSPSSWWWSWSAGRGQHPSSLKPSSGLSIGRVELKGWVEFVGIAEQGKHSCRGRPKSSTIWMRVRIPARMAEMMERTRVVTTMHLTNKKQSILQVTACSNGILVIGHCFQKTYALYGQSWFPKTINCLSISVYSLKNCHNPFGNDFQPPVPYGKIPFEHTVT